MTKQFGKLKLHMSKRGIAFKWGDGEIHRLSFEGTPKDNADPGYGRDDGYGQDGGYSPYDGDYEGGYEGEARDGKYGFLYSSDILMYVLLVLLPPLGIWILWKRQRFSPMLRGIISAASAIWFIVLLIWLFSALFGGGGSDTVTNAGVQPTLISTPIPVTDPSADGLTDTVNAPAPTPLAGGTVSGGTTGDASGTTGTTDALGDIIGADPANTDAGDGTAAADDPNITYVWSSNTGLYYHNTDTCTNIAENEKVAKTDINIARTRAQTACPVCYQNENASGTTYYMTASGTGKQYYHVDATCRGMKNAQATTKAAAVKAGLKVCPYCIGQYYATKDGKWYHKDKNCQGMSGAVNITKSAAVKAGKSACPICLKGSTTSDSSTTSSSSTYYATTSGKYYHVNKTCGGMKNAKKITLAQAKKLKKTPCPVCIGKSSSTASSGKSYYATKSGKYYHVKSDCGGMKNATKVSLAVAKKYGKKPCPVCIGSSSSSSSSSATYYATLSGKYYHKSTSCSTLKNVTGLKKVTKATAVKYGKTACPTCIGADSSSYVYATTGGKYYHKTSTCSGMKSARRMTLANAKKKGKTACPTCYKLSVAENTYYYASASNKYYHKTSTCSGMIGATKVTLAAAKAKGKTACPVCLVKTNTSSYYYATKDNKYYHTKSNCSGMVGASKVTLATAKKAGKTACPVCVKKTATATPTPKVYCYASSGSRYYHKLKNCSGMVGAKKVLLSTAKKKGKTACPICVTGTAKPGNTTTDFADKKTVAYASGDNAYYHANRLCVDGLKKTTVAAAKAKGKTACPVCAKTLSTYVYVTPNGTKYHRKSNCEGLVNPYKVSLSTAVRMNYVRCTKCNAPKVS